MINTPYKMFVARNVQKEPGLTLSADWANLEGTRD